MSKNYIQNVAIVGAGGTVGKFIVEELLKTGKHTVTALTRDDSTNTSTFPAGVKIAKVNYSNLETLVSALRGQDALIITMNVMAPPDTQSKLITAAAAAGVPWVLPNEFGGDPLNVELGIESFLGPAKQKYREEIEALGVSSWISIACGFWYEFSLSAEKSTFGFEFKEKKLTLFGDGNVKISVSTWPLVGKAVASLLSLKIKPESAADHEPTLETVFKNKPCYIASFVISQLDMLDSVLRVTGTKREEWKIEKVDVKEYYKESVGEMRGGDRNGFRKAMYGRGFYPESSGNFSDKGLHNGLLGLGKEEQDDFTKLAIKMSEEAGRTYGSS